MSTKKISLIEALEGIEEPRRDRSVIYPLLDESYLDKVIASWLAS
jgi:hypothetical protein